MIRVCIALVFVFMALPVLAEVPFLGSWALSPAGGGAGWLDVTETDGELRGELLWYGGSPVVQTRVFVDGDTIYAIQMRENEIKDAAGKVQRVQQHPILLTATRSGDTLAGSITQPSTDGKTSTTQVFTGTRALPIPAAPDLGKVHFGKAISLFNGKNLDGWAVFGGAGWATAKEEKAPADKPEGWVPTGSGISNGWFVKDGLLINDPVQTEGKPKLSYGNIGTIREFEDFNLTLEVKVLPKGNSGIYLRGVFEIQVMDSYGMELDNHHMGAVYGRVAPLSTAEKPAGEWQTVDITLVDQHVTVKLNDTLIHDNVPLVACTGGALWSDTAKPGPIFLQGDHTGVTYRNIKLRPVLKK